MVPFPGPSMPAVGSGIVSAPSETVRFSMGADISTDGAERYVVYAIHGEGELLTRTLLSSHASYDAAGRRVRELRAIAKTAA